MAKAPLTSKSKRIITWALGITFALVGIQMLGQGHPFKGIFLLACAALVLPLTLPYVEKAGITMSKWSTRFVYILGIFVMLGAVGQISSNQIPTKQQPMQQSEQKPVLAQHKVIPKDKQGSTRTVHVIVQSSITKDELIAINDNLIDEYADRLTHLTIEYFDDEAIAATYFQKLFQVSEAESDRLFKHYIATYTMNKTTGLNRLNFHVGDDWETVKQY